MSLVTTSETLIGRAAEVDSLNAALTALGSREPSALAVLGEPGIGKSRLLAELAELGDERGCIVLVGSASELEADLPFAVFVDALDEYVAGLDPGRLETVEDDVGAELAQVLPSLSGLARAGEPSLQDERYRAHRAVRELLERIAATKPLVLALDDAHWADPASVELIGALLRRPPSAAVLMVVAARPRQLPERLASALDNAEAAGLLSSLELGVLKREEAVALLGQDLDSQIADRLYEESGGNPFYLEQLARSPEPAEGLATADDLGLAELAVPQAVVRALGEEIARLSRPTRVVLQGAAVAGDPFEPELATAAAAVDEDAAISALDELLELELVRATRVPRRFRFRHPLVRRAVYDGAPAGWVLGAHERCAAELAGRGASATARAHHVAYAGRQGDMDAFAVLCEAAQAAATRAPASAARWLDAALRLLPDDAPPEQRVGLLLAHAQALSATGRLEESREALLESIALVPESAVEMRVMLTVGCAGTEHMLGRYRDARERITRALDELGDPQGREAVSLRVVLAFDGLFSGDLEAMRQAASSALDAARPLGDPRLTAMAAAVLTLACAWGGEIADAEIARKEATELIEAMTDEELAGSIDASAHLAAAEIYLDRYSESEAHAERALAVARATGQQFPTLVPTLASAYFVHGRLADSAEVIEGAIEAARLANNVQDLAWRLHVRSSGALAAGNLETAQATAAEAVELTRTLDESFVSAYPAFALASALEASGDPAGAVEILIERAGGDELGLIPGVWRVAALELLARCRLELGDPEGAARAAARAKASADLLGLPMAAAWSARAEAAMALGAGDASTAAERARTAAAAADEAGAVIEAALSRTLLGVALAQDGAEEEAAIALKRAAADLDACGAIRYRDAAEQELRKQGHRIHRQTRAGEPGATGIASLTGRELEVARLVVDRKTNAEIAAELFLSVKTVETHLRNLFRKLDVSSRVEVARAVERAERNQGS